MKGRFTFIRLMLLGIFILGSGNLYAVDFFNSKGVVVSSDGELYLGYDILSDGTVEITGLYNSNQTNLANNAAAAFVYHLYDIEITIPAEVENDGKTYKVSKIKTGAFFANFEATASITGLSMIDKMDLSHATNLKTIEENACRYLKGVDGTTLKLPHGLETIGKNAFTNTDFEVVDIPETVMSISDDAFNDMDQLKRMTMRWYIIPSGISDNLFKKSATLGKKGILPNKIGYFFVPLISKQWYEKYFAALSKSHDKDYIVRTYVTNDLTSKGFDVVTNKDTDEGGHWGTMSTTVNMRIPEGITAYIVTGCNVDDGTVTVKEVANGNGESFESGIIFKTTKYYGCVPPGSYLICSSEENDDALFYEYTSVYDEDYLNWKLSDDELKTNLLDHYLIYISEDEERTAEGLTSKNIDADYGYHMCYRGSNIRTITDAGKPVDSDETYSDNTNFLVFARYKGDDWDSSKKNYRFGFCYQNRRWWDATHKNDKETYPDGSCVLSTNCKAFLPIESSSNEVKNKLSTLSAFNLVLDESESTDTTDGVEEVDNNDKKDESIFDFFKRRLKDIPQRGFYIKGGKKYYRR